MIAYIKGKLTYKSPTYVILETDGIGYQVNVSLHTYEKINDKTDCRLFTYLQIREDAHTLYGFAEEEEKKMFLQLISISGIGASVAQTLLSSLAPNEVQQTIMDEDVSRLKSIKGIGAKTAKRVILELKDTLVKQTAEAEISASPHNTIQKEALSALQSLGFSSRQANKTLKKVMKEENTDKLTAEELIKEALKRM